MNITVTPDQPGFTFFSVVQWFNALHEAGTLVNILCSNDGECENLLILSYDKEMKAIYVEDEEEDKFLIFVQHIISITPVPEEEEDDEEDEYEMEKNDVKA